MGWYYKEGAQEIGPVSKEELQHLIQAKKINARTPVRSTAMNEWRSLADVVHRRSDNRSAQHQAAPPDEASPQGNTMDSAGSCPTGPQACIAEMEPPPAEIQQPPFMPPAPVKKQFHFTGSGGEYFKIWVVNVILAILTLGIYSAWAKVRRKRYFYGNTLIEGSSFQYVANPMLILKGRIVAFVFFLAFSVTSNFFPVVNLLLTPVLFIALPWMVIRSLAFNAHNSVLRNIRFRFTGTYKEALKVFTLWPLLVPFTLGILAPYAFYRQQKFLVQNMAYGGMRFTFNAGAKNYYQLFLVFILHLALGAVTVALVFFIASPLLPFAIALIYLYVFAFFTVKSTNLLYNSTTLFEPRFESKMALKEYALITFTNTLGIILTIGLFHPIAQVRAYRYKIDHLALYAPGDLEGFTAVQQKQVSAVGGEISDFMDFDFGF